MPLMRFLRPLSLLVALMGASTVAWAQSAPPPPPHAQGQGNGQSQQARDQRALSDAVRRAERNGQVLSAEQVQYDGRDVNRVKIVDDKGRVRVYWDDPAAQQPQDRQPAQDPRGAKPPRGRRTHGDDDGDPTL